MNMRNESDRRYLLHVVLVDRKVCVVRLEEVVNFVRELNFFDADFRMELEMHVDFLWSTGGLLSVTLKWVL